MSLDYLGSLSLAVAVPGAAAGADAGVTGITQAIPNIEAELTALGDFNPLPYDFAADLALANDIVASITAAIATPGLSPPSIDAQLAIVAARVAELEALLTAVNAQLSIVLDLQALLTTAGVFGYAYAGQAASLGGALTTELAGGFPGGSPTDASNAIILATTTPATWTAMQALFKTTP